MGEIRDARLLKCSSVKFQDSVVMFAVQKASVGVPEGTEGDTLHWGDSPSTIEHVQYAKYCCDL